LFPNPNVSPKSNPESIWLLPDSEENPLKALPKSKPKSNFSGLEVPTGRGG